MNVRLRRARALLPLAAVILLPALAFAAGVQPLFDLSSPSGGPFPSDRFAKLDLSNNTLLRVNLPKPDCTVRVSDCQDIDVINTLDGFNLQPRLSIPFSGPIDVSTVDSSTVFLVSLGDARGGRGGHVVGINQIMWDALSNTLRAESDELLDQHTRYLLVVTTGVKGTDGRPVDREAFDDFLDERLSLRHGDLALGVYRLALKVALLEARVPQHRVAAASIFTTQSATAVLEKIRKQITAKTPAPAVIHGTFPLADIFAIQLSRQNGSAPTFATSFLPVPALNIFPSVQAVTFGQFTSPNWETSGQFIPPIGTRTGVPAVQGVNTLQFNLFVPAGTPPADGWPVAIFGHGFTDSKHGAPWTVGSSFAAHGIATIAINVVGHGGGALGTLTIIPKAGAPTVIPDGGRVANVPGGAIIEIARLSPIFRPLVTLSLATRVPALLNAPPPIFFNENIPLRDLPPVINTVPGAMEIQTVIDNTEWVSQEGNPVAYAPHLRKRPLHGIDPPPVIIQFAKGDQTVPNPTASAIFRAGDLTDRSTYFRNDLAQAQNAAVPKNPHTFLTNIANPAAVGYALAAQAQIAIFFESDGTVVVDPDAAGPFFEVPIVGDLPEGLNFIP